MVEGFEEVERIEPLETLSAEQRELLSGVIANEPALAGANLAVYRLRGGRALVAPRTDAISVGDPLIATGAWTSTHFMASSDESVPDVEISVAPEVANATPWIEPTE
jgi:hypothetical protein